MRDGSRKITHIAEVLGCQGDRVVVQDIFMFRQTSVDEDGHVLGEMLPTGVVPKSLEYLRASGEGLDEAIFDSTPAVAVAVAEG